jgi:hypothetical protein
VWPSSTKVQRFLDAARDLLLRTRQPRLVQQRVGDILLDRERVKQPALLKQHAHVAAPVIPGLFIQARDVLAEQFDPAGRGLQQAQRRFQQHRLAAARRAEHDHRFAAPHRERHVAQHRFVTEAQRDPVKRENHWRGGIQHTRATSKRKCGR